MKKLAILCLMLTLCGCGRQEQIIPAAPVGAQVVVSQRTPIEQEMLDMEQQDADLLQKFQTAGDQTEMNKRSRERYALWDKKLNDLWADLGKPQGDLLKEQQAWIEGKQARVELEGNLYRGGTLEQTARDTVGADLTRLRCYRLAAMLAEAKGEAFTLPMPEAKPISFADTQGTDTVYSSLNMTSQDGITYQTVISLHGIGELEGEAEAGEDGFLFRDEVLGVSGGIYYIDGGSGAMLNILHSDWNQLEPGMEFVFSLRMTEAE